MAMLLVDELADFARARGISRLSEIAAVAGVDLGRLKLAVQDRLDLDLREVEALADVVHCRVADLLGPAHVSEGLYELLLSLSPVLKN